MDEGNEVVNQAIQRGKAAAKEVGKKLAKTIVTSPVFWIVVGIAGLLIIVAGAFMIDADITEGYSEGYSNVGNSDFSGQGLIAIAKNLHEYIRKNEYAYSCTHNVEDGYSNECTCDGTSHFGINDFKIYNSLKSIDCSAYVSWVLNQYLGSDAFSTRWWSGNFGDENKWPSGWEKIDINEIQAGDILWKDGHVGIYIGDGKTVEAGCTEAIRAEYSFGSPQSVMQYYTFGIRITGNTNGGYRGGR